MSEANPAPLSRGRYPRAVPGQPRRRYRLRLSRRGQHADSPGPDALRARSCAPSCRGTSRAAASWPRATRAAPARSACAWRPAGPGATNFVTCLADAKMDSVPIVAITGQVGTPVIGTDAFQETPIVEVCRAITKHHYLVTRDRGPAARDEGGVPHRHAPAGPGRSSSTCPRTCRNSRSCPTRTRR